MWSTILLLLKRIGIKKAIDALEKVGGNALNKLSKGQSKKLKSLKSQAKAIDISLISIIALALIITAVLIVSISTFMISTMGTVGSTIVINGADTGENDTEGEEIKDWNWLSQDEALQNGLLDISGGIYPKDPVLKSRAMLLEILTKSSTDVEAKLGVWVEPAYILGTIYRESGNTLYSIIDADKSKSILTDLIVPNPGCAHGSRCTWMKAGVSHFIGGTVKNGKDTGDARTQLINDSAELYKKYGGDHAIGIVQNEIPYVYDRVTRCYPIAEYTVGQNQMDNTLGFIRPNVFYAPDALYNCAFGHAGNDLRTCGNGCENYNPSKYNDILKSSDFKALNKRNQSFIRFVYAGAQYGRGHVHATEDTMVLELINLVKSGKIEYLDEMLKPEASKYYVTSSHTPSGTWGSAENYMIKTYGLTTPVGYTSWYGVYAACAGRVVWDQMLAEIDKAEKDEPISGGIISGAGASNGNWLKYPGSGYFAAVSGGKYYSQRLNATVYRQTLSSTTWADPSWGPKLLNPDCTSSWSSRPDKKATMSTGGCGIYSISFIATNLYGQDLNPGYCRDILGSALKRDNKIVSDYLVNCLTDSGVEYLSKELGLSVKTLNVHGKTNKQLETDIINALKSGNMVLGVFGGGPSDWYRGDGHFMVIRGYNNKNNKMRVYTSAPLAAHSYDIETTSAIELDVGKFKSYIKRQMWIIGLPENMK